jgi:Transposase
MDKAWAGVDAGKEFHWAHVLDASGRELLSRKVENDEAQLLMLIDEALALAEEVIWALDQPGGGAALLLALLCGSETKGSSTSLASPWIGLATPTPWGVQNRCP